MRKARLEVAGASPLSAAKLVTNGARLRNLALFRTVSAAADGRVTSGLHGVAPSLPPLATSHQS